MDENLTDEEYLKKYRGTLQVAVAPHAAAHSGVTVMRDATDEELLWRRGRTFSTLMTDKSVMSPTERKLRTLLALHAGRPGIYTDDGELSDGTEHPFIDFLRDDPEVIEAKLLTRGRSLMAKQYEGEIIIVDYTNYEGKRGVRRIRPLSIIWGSNEWHREDQWLLLARDIDKNADRTFALKDIHMMTGRIDWLVNYLRTAP
jgi:hypothetical protein